MPQLVALDMPGSATYVDELIRVWDRGDAVLPLDQRLSAAARRALATEMKASAVITPNGETSLGSGRPVDTGDALVMCTSGSTGTAKGVVLTHDAIIASARATNERLGVTAAHHWLACLPLAHIGGMSVITKALTANAALTVHAAFDADAVQAAAHDGATHVSLVATALQRIDPSLFHMIVLGGARPPEHLAPNIVTTYGMTETASGVVYDGVPLDGVEVRVHENGEILVRAPMLLRCYRDGSTPIDTDGWLHTNDLGRWSNERLVVEGRRGDLIISGGENVWPEAVEVALAKHPLIADVGVAGLDDPEWGQIVCAWIVPSDARHPPSLEDVRAFVAERLPRFMAPRNVRFVTRLPRNSLGKLRRAEMLSSD